MWFSITSYWKAPNMTQVVNELLREPIMYLLVVANLVLRSLRLESKCNHLSPFGELDLICFQTQVFTISFFFQKDSLLKIILSENSTCMWKQPCHGYMKRFFFFNLNTFSLCASSLLCWLLKAKCISLTSIGPLVLFLGKKEMRPIVNLHYKKMLEGRQ